MFLARNETWGWVWEVVSGRHGQERARKEEGVGKGGKNFKDAWGAVRYSYEIVSHPRTSQRHWSTR